jgi:hypothetical protein
MGDMCFDRFDDASLEVNVWNGHLMTSNLLASHCTERGARSRKCEIILTRPHPIQQEHRQDLRVRTESR